MEFYEPLFFYGSIHIPLLKVSLSVNMVLLLLYTNGGHKAIRCFYIVLHGSDANQVKVHVSKLYISSYLLTFCRQAELRYL